MSREQHWNTVYSTKSNTEVSWYEIDPQPSLSLILDLLPVGGAVIDIGGGASCLVDRLLDVGAIEVAVLDIAAVALDHAKQRLGQRADQVRWIVGDVTKLHDVGQFDVWHDRAAFHFLTDPKDKAAYTTLASNTVRPGGHLVIATFAINGPVKCSGLEICQYDLDSLGNLLAPHFVPVRSIDHLHMTPAGKPQAFQYSIFQRTGNA